MSSDRLMNQLEDLVRMTLECENKELKDMQAYVEVNKRLAELRQVIETLHTSYRKTLERMKISEEQVATYKDNMDKVPSEQKKLFDHLEKLKQMCEEGRERMYTSLQENRETAKEVEEQLETEKKKARKGKFRSVGGKKGWMPT